jgi:peptidoglycan/xylan/chitin deacetylase (PgdA/CDA1 family)
MDHKNKRFNKKKKRQRKRVILAICILILIAVFVGVKLIPKRENQNLQMENNGTSDSGQSNNTEETENKEEVETPKLDNSGYTSFEEDPNADDAAVVAENTKGLLNGTKTYPVRTDGKKVVYLTFDDGPSTTNTPGVLDVLDKYNVKATFFVIGTSIAANDQAKALLKEEVARGHAIANHTYSHDYSYLYPNRVMNVNNIVSDLQKNENAMKEVLGKDFTTRVIRFPGGYWSWEGRTPMKDKMIEKGYCNIDWNALNKDAEGKAKNAGELLQSTKETIEALGPNADSVVLLMHDTYGKEETVKALPEIIEYLQGSGYEFKTIK